MTQTDVRPEPAPSSPTDTLDLYREVHKGLRRALFEVCAAAGALDPADAAARDAVVTRFAELDLMLTLHHDHEDGEAFSDLVASAAPQYVGELQAGHDRAAGGLAALRRAVLELRDGGGADELYDAVTAFAADYLGHMAFEECRVMPALAAAASFEQLLAVQIGIRMAIAPTDMVVFMRSMLPAMNPAERAAMLGGMKAGAPAEIFGMFWQTAGEVLAPEELAVVAGRIGS